MMPAVTQVNGIMEHGAVQGDTLGNGTLVKPRPDGMHRNIDHELDNTPKSVDISEDVVTIDVLAPPLPHITYGFQPLSLLLKRLVQDSYGKLSELIETMNDGNEMARKKSMMKYINDTRQQFIKALVLVQWARASKEVSKVIDLKVWTDSQIMQYNRVVDDLFNVRMGLVNAKVPNPDITTAVRILAAGQPIKSAAAKHYILPPILTAKEILGILRNLNTLLSLRFALHDIPPSYFNNYKIQSGRATFSVANEFEADLSIADENPSLQLYLIDFRLLFTPSLTTIPENRLRGEIEGRANEILRTGGLPGLYNFLHDFILTHKINILRRQASFMARGKWMDTLTITVIKRTLVLQYWVGRTGLKNWLEIGISAGNLEANVPSHLALRWMREAKEVKDVEIPFDQENLSAEVLLNSVINLHTAYLLTSIRNHCSSLSIFPPATLNLHIEEDHKIMSFLDVAVTPSRTLTLVIEPITGRFALKKPSLNIIRGERQLNELPEPATKGHEVLIKLRFMIMQEEIETRAISMGWDILKMLTPKLPDIKKWFVPAPMLLMYIRKKSWAQNWIIVVSLGISGDFWWIAEIAEAARGWSIPDAQQIPITGPQNVTYQFLENLEKMVACFITLYTNTRKLSTDNIPYKFMPTKNPNAPIVVPTLNIDFKTLSRSEWGVNVLRLSVHDLDQAGNITILVEGRMKNPMTRLKSNELSATSSDVAFHPHSGTFILRFVVPVGSVITTAIVERLKRIERLITFITMVQKYKLPALHVTLDKMSFRYCQKRNLSAEVTFIEDNRMQLRFPPSKNNPHRRINEFLNMLLNERGLEAVVWTLRMTLPLLVALDEIEDNSPESSLYIIPRSAEWYRLEYPQRSVLIDIKLRTRRNSIWWFIKDATLVHAVHEGILGGSTGEDHVVAEQLRRVWQSSEKSIEGLKTGTAATTESIGTVIKNVHDLIMNGASGNPQEP